MADDIGLRRTEVAAIERVLDGATGGHGAVVIIQGEAGIGKSYLLDVGARAATDRGAMVLHVGLTEVEQMLSWAGLSVLLHRIDDWEPVGFPTASRAVLDRARQVTLDGRVRAEEVASSFSQLVTQVTSERPLVLVVDDIQWLDRESAAALAFAIRANADRRLAVLVGHRTGETASVDLDRLAATELVRISLRGFAVAGVRLLLKQAGYHSVRRQDLVGIHTLSGGNPFRAVELARRLDGGERLADLALTTVRGELAVKIEDLSAAELDAARTCALIAHPTTTTVRAILGNDVDDALIALERRQVIAIERGSITFTHPLRRHAVLHDWGELERRRCHARIGEALDDPEQSLLHRSEAVDEPDAELAAAIEASAGAAASIGALEVAAQRFLRAAALTPPQDHHGRWRRREQSVRSSVMLGDIEDVAEQAAELFESASTPDDVVQATIDLTEIRRLSSGVPSAIQVVNAGLERLSGDSVRRMPLLARLVRLEQFVDLGAAARTARRAVTEARLGSDGTLVRRAEAMAASVGLLAGETIDLDALTAPSDEPDEIGVDAWVFYSELLVWTSHIDEAQRLLEPAIARARSRGEVVSLARSLGLLGDAYTRSGRWDRAEQCFLEAAELRESAEDNNNDRASLAWISAARGDVGRARAQLALDSPGLLEGPDLNTITRLAIAGFVEICAADPSRAVELLALARTLSDAIGFVDAAVFPFGHDLVEAYVQIGEIDAAADEAERFVAAADRANSTFGSALGRRSAATVCSERGDHIAAVALVREALALHAEVPGPFEAARTQLVAATVLRRAGQRVAARAALEQASAAFETLGAIDLLRRADAELERFAARRSPDVLTRAERDVARLVVAGRTNKEIAGELHISLRTVESNLTRIYRKMDVRSRTELTAKLISAP